MRFLAALQGGTTGSEPAVPIGPQRLFSGPRSASDRTGTAIAASRQGPNAVRPLSRINAAHRQPADQSFLSYPSPRGLQLESNRAQCTS